MSRQRRWLRPLLALEVANAQAELPTDSSEHAASAWAFGKTKLFMRGYLFAHLGRRLAHEIL